MRSELPLPLHQKVIDDLVNLGFVRCMNVFHDLWGEPVRGVFRPSVVSGCFERIDLLGRDEVIVSAIVSVVPGRVTYPGLAVRKDVKACYAVLSKADRTEWHRKVVQLAPRRVRDLAIRVGEELVTNTKRGRKAARFYLGLLPPRIDDAEAFWRDQKCRATECEREQARSSLRMGLLTLKGDPHHDGDRAYYAYQIAAYTMTLNAERAVPLGFFPPGTDPEVDHDMAYCFQIMASCIYGEPGCELICFE